MHRIPTLILLLLISVNIKSQINCDIDYVGPVESCSGIPIQTVYAGDLSARIGFEYNFSNPQGPYDIQVNGITFENEYLWSFDPFCCDDIYASDFSYDFEIPGNYVFDIESVSHENNECIPVTGSPYSSHTVTVIPPPSFDFRYQCLPNGDVKLDVILTSQLLPYTSLFFLTFEGFASSTLIESAQAGDTIHTKIRTLTVGETYNVYLHDCALGTDFLRSEYTHNCTSCTDSTPPSAQCKDLAISLGEQPVDINYTDIDNGSIDDCQIVSYGLTEYTFDCSDIGQNIVTLQVADGAGNSSECTSIVTVSDNANTCGSCYLLDRSPEIEFSHTEIDGNFINIWYRFVDLADYGHLNPRLSYINSANYVIQETGFGEIGRFPIGLSGANSTFDYLEEFMYMRLQRSFQFQDCDRIETNLFFVDDFCDVSYISNSIILNCDNDNDGFAIDVDCNDNNAMQFPGATEICDGIDNNCDGQIDEGFNDIFGHCCPFELNVDAPGIVNGRFKADYRINSEGQVLNNNVEFQAGSEVNLETGFEVKAGSVFHAHIGACN